MQLAFICTPYAQLDISRALFIARELSKKALAEGYIPISPVLNFHEVMTESNSNERQRVLDICKQLLEQCEVVFVADTSYGISSGMQGEIDLANKLQKPVITREVTVYYTTNFVFTGAQE